MLWELSATKTGYTISTFPKRFRELLKEEGLLEDYNGNLLVLPQRDEPFFVGPDFTVLPIDKEPFYAIGSGEDYAFGAMAMAAPNWNIVAVYDVVAHYDTGTGGTIKRYSWDEDGAVEVVGVAYV
jgi:ATP-dependent protease HslVU (ClpYQ) peptidase subunit